MSYHIPQKSIRQNYLPKHLSHINWFKMPIESPDSSAGIRRSHTHYGDVIMGGIASQITSLTIVVFSTVYSEADLRKHQSSASLAEDRWIPRKKWPITRKMFKFDGVIMDINCYRWQYIYRKCMRAIRFCFGITNISGMIFTKILLHGLPCFEYIVAWLSWNLA